MRTIAIIGRPDVGKSTLFNRLVGQRRAIVDPTPGVTRDWLDGIVEIDGVSIRVVDTGGLSLDELDPFTTRIRAQTQAAIEHADALIFLLDRHGVSADDHAVAELIRDCGKPAILVVNRVDGSEQLPSIYEASELGLDTEILGISAAYGYGFPDLKSRVRRLALSAEAAGPSAEVHSDDIRIAILGRPNAGKSTLFNRLVGTDRSLVSDVPGTTRDAIIDHLEFGGKTIRIVDTAGMRRRTKVVERIETMSVKQAVQAVIESEIVILMVDANAQLTDQDKKIAGIAMNNGRGLIIAMNKIDLLGDLDQPATTSTSGRLLKGKQVKDAIDRMRFLFGAADFVPILPMDAKQGVGIKEVLAMVVRLHHAYHHRVKTSDLNRMIQDALRTHPPSGKQGRLKVLFAGQVTAAPPRFMLSINQARGLPKAYCQYLENCIRKTFSFEGIPIQLDIQTRSSEGSRRD